MRGLRIVSVVLCLLAALAPARVLADPATDAFHAEVAAAYRHYREAVHYFENDGVEPGAIALDHFVAAWRPIAAKYADAPPPGYLRFPDRFKYVLGRILEVAQNASGAPDQVVRDLNQIRVALYWLRRANNIRTYSDCIDRMNEAMRRLWAYRRKPPVAADADGLIAYRIALYETTLWYRQCRDEAPAAHRETDEFRRLFDGALHSLARLEALKIDEAELRDSILRELHSFDRLIWLKFG